MTAKKSTKTGKNFIGGGGFFWPEYIPLPRCICCQLSKQGRLGMNNELIQDNGGSGGGRTGLAIICL